MKIADKFQEFEEIFKSGYLFDPENHLFFQHTDDFVAPQGFLDWDVQKIDLKHYGVQRLQEMGVTDENNTIKLSGQADNPLSNELIDEKIFIISKTGSIEITQYSLHGKYHLKKENQTDSQARSGVKTGYSYCYSERQHPVIAELTDARYNFTNSINTPFWPPLLMQAFAAKETIETLIITEGQFKSWVACDNGLYCVGLTSISHFRNQETESIHPEIIEFIQACQVKKVVILWDGDCCNISTKDLLFKNDLSNRPNDFYKYAVKIRDEIKRFVKAKNFTIFFSTINSRKIYQEAKGIDDWFLGFKDPQDRVVVNEEFEKIGKLPGSLIYWEDITLDYGIKKIRAFFGLDFVNNFYQKHKNIIGNQSFLFFGNDYQIIKDLPVLQVSKDLKKFKRIGTNYYQLVDVPIPNGKKDDTIMEERLVPWEKSTIIDDHGKDSHKHIERFKGFTNIPSHTDYQPVIKGHWNLYYNINHQSKEGSWPTIKIFLQHLFEEQEENDMIYDYLTLLYRKPMLKLPIICLVSKEQGTGKSTFIYLLKLIFKQNLSIISSQELSGDFNAHWASSLIVACEETFLEKFETSEKIKNLSTGFETFRNEKNKTSSPIPNMLHFVFCSNHEDNFVKLDDEDSRYWIRKIQSRKQTIANFDQMLESEIPYFVNFLEKREITYKSDGDRLFFAPKDFDTKAKHNVIKDSEPVFIKDIKDSITEYFYRFDDVDTLLMTAENLKQYFSIKYSDRSAKNKINKQIREYLKVERWKSANGKEGPTTYSFYSTTQVDPEKKVKETYKGRPFVFKRENFISDEV